MNEEKKLSTFEYLQLQKKKDEGTIEEKEIIELNPNISNDKAFISNELLKAMFHRKGSYSVIQLLIYIASQGEKNTTKDGDYYNIQIDLDDFIEKHGTKRGTLYNHLDNIQNTVVTYYDNKDRKLEDKISLISRQKMITRSIIQIDMHEKIYCKIKESSNYSILQASNFQNNLSYNSLRVLLLCGMINNYDTPRKEFDLAELNFLFDVNYKNLYEFDRQIFKKAQVELDESSNLSFVTERVDSLEDVERGRPKKKAIRLSTVVNNEWKDDLKFVKFRKAIRSKYVNQRIILLTDIERYLTISEDGLLAIENGKILTRKTAGEYWEYLYNNKDKILAPSLFVEENIEK